MNSKVLTTFLSMLFILVVIAACCPIKPNPPVLKTYSISGDITLVNDCSGNGADNPRQVKLTAKLWYTTDGAIPSYSSTKTFPMVLQADGVTSKGTYTFSDVPTNLTGKEWRITFEDLCATIPCPPGLSCKNFGTNVRQPIAVQNTAETYDYRYNCTCN